MNDIKGRNGQLRIQDGEMVYDLDCSVKAATTKNYHQSFTPAQSREGYRSLNINRRMTDFKKDKQAADTLPAPVKNHLRISKERMGKSSSPKRRSRNKNEAMQ